MTNIYKIIISAQEFEVEAEDDAEALFEAQSLVEIDDIILVGSVE